MRTIVQYCPCTPKHLDVASDEAHGVGQRSGTIELGSHAGPGRQQAGDVVCGKRRVTFATARQLA